MTHPGTRRFTTSLLATLLAWGPAPAWPLPQNPPRPTAAEPAARTSKENAKKARSAYDLGRRAEQQGQWREAHEHFAEAAQLDPQAEYARAREAARFRRVQQHVDRAEGATVAGNFTQAQMELRAALTLDPGYEIARERLAQVEARAAQQARFSGETEGPLLPKLRARQPARRDVSFRGNTRGAYEEIARLFGVTATFDDQLRVRPLQFRVPSVDLETALNLLAAQSSTFWFAVDQHSFFVADHTVQKVREFAPVIVRTIPLPNSASNERMTEILRLLREIGGLTRLQLDLRNRSMTVRDTPENVALAAALIEEFEQPRGELMLEISLLEIDRGEAQRLGIRPPTSAQVFTLSPQDLDRIQNPSSPGELADLLQRIFGTSGAGGVGGLVPPLVAFGGGRTVALATLPGAAADFSQALSVLRRARRVLLRAGDGEPASFFIGERFPINLAVLTAGTNSFTGTIGGDTAEIVPRRDFNVGDAPVAITTFDFNADQVGDLAVVNQNDDTVSILLGNGDGSFATPADFATGDAPASIAAGDFNADGILDLVTADQGANTVSVLFGNGDGTFDAPVAFGTGVSPRAVVVANLNGDSRLDLVVANGNDNTISVLLGNTTTTFAARTDFSVGLAPVALAVDDFDDDNFLDVAVANSGDDTVSVLLGAGNGTLAAAASFAVGDGPRALATNDMNRDQLTDIVTANENGDTVSILLGNGDGTFGPATDFTAGNGPSALFIADFDGSGSLDLLVTNRNADTFSLIFGNGDGTLGLRADFATGDGPVAVAVANFNGDGRLDAAIVNQAGDSITIILNSSTIITPGGLVPQQPYPGVQYEELGLKVKATPRMHLNGEVTLQMAFEIRTRSGEAFNGIPIISNRTLEQMVRTRQNETTVLAGMLQREDRLGLEGWPGLAYAPAAGRALTQRNADQRETELLIFVTPRQIRMAPRTDRSLYTGRETPGALTGRQAAGPPN